MKSGDDLSFQIQRLPISGYFSNTGFRGIKSDSVSISMTLYNSKYKGYFQTPIDHDHINAE